MSATLPPNHSLSSSFNTVVIQAHSYPVHSTSAYEANGTGMSRASHADPRWTGQVIWITGASSGIGAALAKQWAAKGAILVLSARRAALLEALQQELVNSSQHLVLPLDLTDATAMELAVQQVLAQFGRVDWLINNAGVSQRATILQTQLATERQLMELDYFAQIQLTRLLLPSMLAAKQGQVVFISSVAGLVGTQYRAGYSAAKAALHMWANSLRAEHHADGIFVATVFPGFVHTAVSQHALTGDGTALGHMDQAQANAMSADQFATKTIQALARRRQHIVIGGLKERFAAWLIGIAPSLLYRLIRRAAVR